jgi:hypothetical protein
VVEALAVAYPVEREWDVAAILIRGAAETTLPAADDLPSDGENVQGEARGYAGGADAHVRLGSRITRSGRLLRELDKPSITGMSGGPVCRTDDTVIGIQSRDDQGEGIATLLDFDILNHCALHVRSFEP